MTKLNLSPQALTIGDIIQGTALVLSCEARTAANGPYIVFKLTDGICELEAKKWQSSTIYSTGMVYNIIGSVDEYKGVLSINVKRISVTEEDPTAYYKHGPIPTDQVLTLLSDMVLSCNIADYRLVGTTLLMDYAESCKTSVAARGVHHNYLGGWAQHTLEVVNNAVALMVAMQETTKNTYCRDLVIIGALLHDIGKFRGYYFDCGEIDLTTEGKFNEHIVLGAIMCHEICRKTKVAENVENLLTHCIVSHHGKAEWGSPVSPVCPEAYFIHMADQVSAKITIMQNEPYPGSDWSKKNYFTGASIYFGSKE